jgi:acyl carrier protein
MGAVAHRGFVAHQGQPANSQKEIGMEVQARIREFINGELIHGGGKSVDSDDAPLLDGAIDSVGLLQLVSFLEESFGVAIDDTEIVPQHFSTVHSISDLVRKHLDDRSGVDAS